MAVPIRIITLLIFIAAMATGRLSLLLGGSALLLCVATWVWQQQQGLDVQGLWRMLSRVRWLLLAIVLLYGWFTPGVALLPALQHFSPTVEGMQQGLLRAAVLLLIVTAVYLLLTATPRGDLVAGLLWYGRPLRRIGIDDERFAIRLVLALEAVPQVQALAREALNSVPRDLPKLQRLSYAVSAVFQATLTQAEQTITVIDVPDAQPLPPWQWLIPLTLAVVMLAALAV